VNLDGQGHQLITLKAHTNQPTQPGSILFYRMLQILSAVLVAGINYQWFGLAGKDKRTQAANSRQYQLMTIGRNPFHLDLHQGGNIKRENLTVLEVGDFHGITSLV
jgi:hypothetical protein